MTLALPALLVVLAAPPPATATWQARVRMVKAGKTSFVPVGEVTRGADGNVAIRGLPAPALDDVGRKLEKQWKELKRPEKISVTQTIASDTGMRPSYQPHTVTFEPKDKLFTPAVIKKFFEDHGYECPSLQLVKFVIYDESSEDPPLALDRSSKRSNFRKGDGENQNVSQFYAKLKVRPTTSPGPLRNSASDPKLFVATDYDDGLEDIALLILNEDGTVTIQQRTAAANFEGQWNPGPQEDVEVATVNDAGEWGKIVVSKSSPKAVEAYVITRLERYGHYDVTPVIDPATLR
jgi:hypothetical protein